MKTLKQKFRHLFYFYFKPKNFTNFCLVHDDPVRRIIGSLTTTNLSELLEILSLVTKIKKGFHLVTERVWLLFNIKYLSPFWPLNIIVTTPSYHYIIQTFINYISLVFYFHKSQKESKIIIFLIVGEVTTHTPSPGTCTNQFYFTPKDGSYIRKKTEKEFTK